MKPRFLGEGTSEQQNIEYWQSRSDYWSKAARKTKGWRKKIY